MKQWVGTVLALLLVISLCACGEKSILQDGSSSGSNTTWQEQYDLGVRYLSEGNYEEAIVAFTVAIEIDPKQAPAYVGRGDAYVDLGETEENLAEAKTDYEMAIEQDGENIQAYLGLAKVHGAMGEYQLAIDILNQGFNKTQSEEISEMINTISMRDDAFYNSEAFVPIQSLEAEYRQLLKNIIQLLPKGDTDTLKELLQDDALFENITTETKSYDGSKLARLRTIIDNNKVQVDFMRGSAENTTGTVGTYTDIEVEMRPEFGTGYYFHFNSSSVSDQWVTDYAFGNCDDWNWNGKFENIDIVGNDYGTIKHQSTGIVVDGLLDGEVQVTETDYTGNSDEYLQTFSNGNLTGFWEYDRYVIGYIISENGERVPHETTDGPWYNWYCTYKTGAGSSCGIEGISDLKWG